ncbi:hypothetical protein C4565_08320 [Candidatus Parcubacteria bacterium]|nr:MAG: hypothetical protein C4565_08320 [Candidatus Parcubacteria bacterium]
MSVPVSQPFVFNKPTYVIKAVDSGRLSPVARYPWPESGPVDDRANFVAEMKCKAGLYGFTLDQVVNSTYFRGAYHDHFRVTSEKKIFLILEVESSEIVHEGIQIKVPRCNVVGSFDSNDWKSFCSAWLNFMGQAELLGELETKFVSWMGFIALTEEIVQELRNWVVANRTLRISGDGLRTQAERDAYQFWVSFDFKTESITEAKAKDLANFFNTCGDPGVRLELWAKVQKNSNWLFAIHRDIEAIMAATATGDVVDTDTYPAGDYLSPWSDNFRKLGLNYNLVDFVPADRMIVTNILRGVMF